MKPYISVIFHGGSGPPAPPLWVRTCFLAGNDLLTNPLIRNFFLLFNQTTCFLIFSEKHMAFGWKILCRHYKFFKEKWTTEDRIHIQKS